MMSAPNTAPNARRRYRNGAYASSLCTSIATPRPYSSSQRQAPTTSTPRWLKYGSSTTPWPAARLARACSGAFSPKRSGVRIAPSASNANASPASRGPVACRIDANTAFAGWAMPSAAITRPLSSGTAVAIQASGGPGRNRGAPEMRSESRIGRRETGSAAHAGTESSRPPAFAAPDGPCAPAGWTVSGASRAGPSRTTGSFRESGLR